jgi:hypothetical protein
MASAIYFIGYEEGEHCCLKVGLKRDVSTAARFDVSLPDTSVPLSQATN